MPQGTYGNGADGPFGPPPGSDGDQQWPQAPGQQPDSGDAGQAGPHGTAAGQAPLGSPGVPPSGYAPPSGDGSSPPGYGPPPGGVPHPGGAGGSQHHPWGHGADPRMLARLHRPGVVPLAPLTLGDIFGGAFRTVQKNPKATVGLAVLVGAFVMLLPTAVGAAVAVWTDSDIESGNTVWVDYGSSLLTWLVSIVLAGLLAYVVSEAAQGRKATMGQAWKAVSGRVLPLVGASALVTVGAFLIVGVVAAVIVALALQDLIVGAILSGMLLALGALILMVWLHVRLMLIGPAIVLEHASVLGSFRRSWNLSKGQFWRLFGISLLANLLAGLIAGMIATPFSLIAAFLMLSVEGPGGVIAYLVVSYLTALISLAITTPFTAAVTCLLYLDQRFRREGLDAVLLRQVQEQAQSDST